MVTTCLTPGASRTRRIMWLDEIAEVLLGAAAAAASLTLKVDCGGDYEALEVIATITVADLDVTVGPPEVARSGSTSDEERLDRVVHALLHA